VKWEILDFLDDRVLMEYLVMEERRACREKLALKVIPVAMVYLAPKVPWD